MDQQISDSANSFHRCGTLIIQLYPVAPSVCHLSYLSRRKTRKKGTAHQKVTLNNGLFFSKIHHQMIW